MDFSLLEIFSALKPAWQALQPARARRKVALGDYSKITNLDNQLDKILDILSHKSSNIPTSLKNSCLSFLSNLDAIFAKPFMQEWLNKQETRNLFKEKVKNNFSGIESKDLDDELKLSYMKLSGENEHSAKDAIELTHQLLIKSLEALFSDQTMIVQELETIKLKKITQDLKEVYELLTQQNHHLEQLENNLGEKGQTQYLVDKEVQSLFDCALQRLHFTEIDSLNELLKLARRAKDGNLASANRSIRTLIFREIARQYLGEKDTELGIAWLKEAKKLSPNDDYQIDDLRVLLSSGNIDKALTEAKKINSREVKEFILNVLLTHKDITTAVNYYTLEIEKSSFQSGRYLLNFALKLCEVGNYEFALKLLANATPEHTQMCSAIIPIRALVKVAICTGSTEKDSLFSLNPIHPKLVKFNDTPVKKELRLSALDDINTFLTTSHTLNLREFQHSIEEIKLWINLEHPDENIRNKNRIEFNESVSDIGFAIKYSRFAFDYGHPLDLRSMESYLTMQKSLGNLTANETIATLLLALNKNTPQEVLALLDTNRDDIIKIIKEGDFVCLKAEVLCNCGLHNECENYITENSLTLGQTKVSALKSILLSENLNDPIMRYREAFELTKGDGERRLLIKALEENNKNLEAAEHLDYFFQKTPSYEEAEKILFLYIKSEEYKRASNFLSRQVVESLVSENPKLQSLNAWVTYFNGNILEAILALQKLPTRRDKYDNNFRLAILIAQETGNWEEALDELVYAKQNIDTLSGEELVRYAGLSWLINAPKQLTFDLLKAAALKNSDANDAFGLTQVYSLAIRIGGDQLNNIAEKAFKQAHKISSTVGGPLKSVPLNDLKSLLSQAQEQEKNIADKIRTGTMPQVLAVQKNGALCNAIAGQMIRNNKQHDWRKKSCLPLFSGSIAKESLARVHSIAFDRSSLITLSYLGLLEKAFDAFERIMIASSCMPEFLQELENVRFHQASQIADAQLIQGLIAEQKIKIVENYSTSGKTTIPNGMNRELAKLIMHAERNGGYVVVAQEEYTTTSFLEEKIDLSGVDSLIIDLVEIIDFLYQEASIEKNKAEEIKKKHYANHTYCVKHKHIAKETPLYLDGYALDCLIRYGIIENTLHVYKNIYISRFTQYQELDLLSYIKQQSEVEDIINTIRRNIKREIAQGKLRFTTRGKNTDPDCCISLATLLSNNGEFDAITIDDRFFNKSDTDQTLIISSLDILKHLFNSSAITEQDLIGSYKKLRKSGAVFVPISSKEIIDAATQSCNQEKKSNDLIEIIEYLCTIGKNSILNLPEEIHFIISCIMPCATAIKDIWKNEKCPDTARKKSTYIHAIVDSLYLCLPTTDVPLFTQAYNRIAATVVTMLANPSLPYDPEKLKGYFDFVEEYTLPDEYNLKNNILPYVGSMLRELIDSLYQNTDLIQKGYNYCDIINFFISQLPPQVKSAVMKDTIFFERYMLACGQLTICQYPIKYDYFMTKTREIANGKRDKFSAPFRNGVSIKATRTKNGTIQFEHKNIISELTAGCILSDSAEMRKKNFFELKKTYDFPPEFTQKWKSKISDNLTNSDFWNFNRDLVNLPCVVLNKIEHEMSYSKKLNYKHCIPKSSETFIALFGRPNQSNIDNFFSASATWQGKLVAKSLPDALLRFGPSAVIPSKQLFEQSLFNEKHISDEALKSCIKNYKDPFTLMLIFDICAALFQKNGKYIELGEAIIKKVAESTSSNIFIDFEISLHFVFPLLVKQGILKDFPLYYQRVCIWGWAGHISRILNHYDFDREAVLTDLKAALINDRHFLNIKDIQEGPYWQPLHISTHYLSGFLKNRLAASVEVFCPKNIPQKWKNLLFKVASDAEASTDTIYSLYPNPFSGLSQHYIVPIIPDEIFNEISNNFASRSSEEDFLLSIVPYSNFFKFHSKTIEQINTSCANLHSTFSDISDKQFSKVSYGVSRVAQMNGSSELAETLMDWIFSRIFDQGKKEELVSVYVALRTFTSFETTDDANKFLREKLITAALICKDKIAIEHCLNIIKQIEFIFPELRPYLLTSRSIFTLGSYAN